MDALRAEKVWDWVDHHGTDDYGFTFLPNGRRNDYDGELWGAGSGIDGQYGLYWTSVPSRAFHIVNYDNKIPSFVGQGKNDGAAVRCVKD